jgi:hypothetical protein
VEQLGRIEGQGREEVEEWVAIAIDQIRSPTGPESALAQAMIQLYEATEVVAPIVAAGHSGFEQGLNSNKP